MITDVELRSNPGNRHKQGCTGLSHLKATCSPSLYHNPIITLT